MRYRIQQEGRTVNTIVAEEAFVREYCRRHGCTYEEAPLSVPEPVPEPGTEGADVWADMAAAIVEGVNEV